MHPFNGALHLPYVPARVTRGALVAHIGTLSRLLVVGLLSTVKPLCPSQCLSGTILVTLYFMVWACEFLEQDQCFPVGIICSFFLSPTIFFFSSFHGLVGWGCGPD